MSSDGNLEKDAVRTCTTNQSMIDLTYKHLEELRTQCSSTDKITQIEIRDAESKLIRMVGNQLVAKQKLNVNSMPNELREYPKLDLWLRIVGIPEDTVQDILDEGLSFSDLLEMDKDRLVSLLRHFHSSDLEVKTVLTAFKNLRVCTEKQLEGITTADCDWHFTDLACLQAATAASRSTTNSPAAGNSPKHQQRTASTSSSTASVTSADTPPNSRPTEYSLELARGTKHSTVLSNNVGDIPPARSTPSSPGPSPHAQNESPPQNRSKSVSSPAVRYPITPPPMKSYKLFPDSAAITKSKSHESQLANKVVDIDPIKSNKKNKPLTANTKLGGSHEVLIRRRLSTDGTEAGSRPTGHSSPVVCSPVRTLPYKHDPGSALVDDFNKYSNMLTVPKSPKTPLKVYHQICHRFANTFKITTCDYCHKQMILGYKCKHCKKKFHKDCAQRTAASCGLSDAAVDALLELQESPITQRRFPKADVLTGTWDDDFKHLRSMPTFLTGPLPGSGSSSCNSSSPSSPAYHQTSSDTITSPSPASPYSNSHTQFNFPDVTSTLPADFGIPVQKTSYSQDTDVVSTNTSNDSEKTLIDSNASEHAMPERTDSVDSQDDPFNWNRQNSLAATMKEWDIPYDDLMFLEAIGKGRLGTVYKGLWHGDVAIKVLDTGSSADMDLQLAAFKLEIAILRKTRHENLVLFMGACMTPPRLAIVTSFCKGQTLFTMIHLSKNLFKINKAIIIASQIAQGMSYLHARGIIHKDLRTKNIFMDSGKVIIADFGLFHITKLCRGTKKDNWLSVPKGWLCYLAPEIIRVLKAMQQSQSDLPFTKMSDVYAFGTVWFELLCMDWPFRNQPCEAIIWQVGRGIKQSLNSVFAPREVKEILMSCWVFHASDRPDFAQIAKALDRIPRTHLIRSPSHPAQLRRSSEGLS